MFGAEPALPRLLVTRHLPQNQWTMLPLVEALATSTRPEPQATVLGPEVSDPPRLAQLPQPTPVLRYFCQSAPSAPRANTSRLPTSREATAGAEETSP